MEPSPDEIKRCIETLQALVSERGHLAQVPEELRIALLCAAGRLSRPNKIESLKLSRALREQNKKKLDAQDRAVRASTAIRQARQAPVFAAPSPLLLDQQPQRENIELSKPRYCYVCKAEFK